MNTVTTRNGNGPAAAIENVVIRGDLSKLTEAERTTYYMAVCKSVGLNPLTKPMEYITLNGKLTLYALRNCTDQLRAIHKISVADMTETERDGVYIVTCKVSNAEGRTDISKGAVNIEKLRGEALANALMKAETKAKRRATLSICGLSLLDETEVEDIPASVRQNPHITRPSDVAEMTAEEIAAVTDDIPPGKQPVRKLLVAEQRPLFDAKLKEMEATGTPEELNAWGVTNADEVAKFKADWQQIFRDCYKAHMASLRNKPADDPAVLAERILAAVSDPSLLDPTWDYQLEPMFADLSAAKQEEVMGIYRKHEKRLSP